MVTNYSNGSDSAFLGESVAGVLHEQGGGQGGESE